MNDKKEIILFGGNYDGLMRLVNDDSTKLLVGDDKQEYFLVPLYPLAVTKDIMSMQEPFNFVLKELLQSYSKIRQGGEMQEAKVALKKRVKALNPGAWFYIFSMWILSVHAYMGAPYMGGILTFIFMFGYWQGFTKIKKYIKNLV